MNTSSNALYAADGTFAIVPKDFNQLYTVHSLQKSSSFPCIYALLPDRRQETYSRLFNVIKELQPSFEPNIIMTDFERAAINAFQNAFPNAEYRGCFFHFCQSLWRKVLNIF